MPCSRTYRKRSLANDANARIAVGREIGNNQMPISRRGQEQARMREEISKLISETGALPSMKAA